MNIVYVDAHDRLAATRSGLRTLLKAMRWEDIEWFTTQLDIERRNGNYKSSARLTASHVLRVANYTPTATIVPEKTVPAEARP